MYEQLQQKNIRKYDFKSVEFLFMLFEEMFVELQFINLKRLDHWLIGGNMCIVYEFLFILFLNMVVKSLNVYIKPVNIYWRKFSNFLLKMGMRRIFILWWEEVMGPQVLSCLLSS